MVVATSLLKGSSPAADLANARSYFGQRGDGGSATSEAKLNGHVAGQERKKDADNWSEISGSSHDHWDVVKSVSRSGMLQERVLFALVFLRNSPLICFKSSDSVWMYNSPEELWDALKDPQIKVN